MVEIKQIDITKDDLKLLMQGYQIYIDNFKAPEGGYNWSNEERILTNLKAYFKG